MIATFNDEPDHLRRAVSSALGQTYPVAEVVVVNDGSTRPATVAAIEALTDVTIVHQTNAGPAAARNAGIRRMSSDLVVNLDADDWLDSHFVEEAVGLMENPETQIAYPSTQFFGDVEDFSRAVHEFHLSHLMDVNKVASAAMFRMARWREVGGYYEPLRFGEEDYEFWIRVLREGGVASPLPSAKLHYRIRPNSRARTVVRDGLAQTRPTIVEANAGHTEALLLAAFERMDQLNSDLKAREKELARWQHRAAPLIKARRAWKRLTTR